MIVIEVPVENEMDFTLAYKKSFRVAELLGLSIATQTAFATAVSEVCREVIDKTQQGLLSIALTQEEDRFALLAKTTFLIESNDGALENGLHYAKRLIPNFAVRIDESSGEITLQLGIPRSLRVSMQKIASIKTHFLHTEPLSPYEELRQQNTKLVDQNEHSAELLRHLEYINEQKSEFLSVASHELKTPLTILRAYTQLALSGECSPETFGHLTKVDKQAAKIQTLIQQLLDISKIEHNTGAYTMEPVDLDVYLTDLMELIRKLVPNHSLTVDLHSGKHVMLDRLRMEQVVTNIIGNAAKYSPLGSTIYFRSMALSDGQITLEIQDQGIGMSEVERGKIFDKFYRVEEVLANYHGLGMGLYISSKIIQDHNGSISVESVQGQGSTFKIFLPALPYL